MSDELVGPCSAEKTLPFLEKKENNSMKQAIEAPGVIVQTSLCSLALSCSSCRGEG